MRKIREVLRLYFVSIRAIARSLGTSPRRWASTCAALASWPAIDDAGLERRCPALPSSHTSRPLPDRGAPGAAGQERNAGLALGRVQGDPSRGVAVQPVLRAVPWKARPGDAPGAPRRRGCSSTTPGRRCRWSTPRPARSVKRRSSWPCSAPGHLDADPAGLDGLARRAFEFYGGCPELVIPDNLRSGVSGAHRYEPAESDLSHLASHYGVAVLPAPSPKGQGEGGGRRSNRRAVDTRRASPSQVLLAGRAQRRGLQAARPAQHAPVPQAPGVAALAVAGRPAGAVPAAVQPVRLRRVKTVRATTTWKSTATTTRFPTRWSGASSTSA